MNWIDVNDKLPHDGEYVLGYMGNYCQSMKYDVVRFVRGMSEKERSELKDEDVRKRTYYGEDEYGNNQKPFKWDTFGPMSYFGQECTHWMPLPQKPILNKEQ